MENFYSFSEESIINYFKRSLENKIVPQVLLLIGVKELLNEVEKKIVRILLCKDKIGCGNCKSCIKLKEEIHPDLFLIKPEKDKLSISIDQIRNIISEANLKPWESSFKIFIIKDIEYLRDEASNALLKILEEPPDYCIFILTSLKKEGILDTILSRAQIFYIGEDLQEIIKKLKKEYKNISDKEIETLALLSRSFFSAKKILEEEKWKQRKEIFHTFFNEYDPILIAEKIVNYCGSGEKSKILTLDFLNYISSFWRDVLVYRFIKGSNLAEDFFLINKDLIFHIKKIENSVLSNIEIYNFLFYIFKVKKYIEFNVNLNLIWENIIIKMYILLNKIKK